MSDGNSAPPGAPKDMRAELRQKALEQRAEYDEREAERDRQATRELADAWITAAMKATGLSREELLERSRNAQDEPEDSQVSKPYRASRNAVAGRGVPEKHIRACYDQEPDPCDALDAVRDFMMNPALTILVLSGGTGTMRSGSAATALFSRAGLFVSADDLSTLAARRTEEAAEKYRLAKTLDVLVLDDLGTEFNDDKGWFVRALNAVVNARYEACVKTIITCNLGPAEFKAAYGERIADRIRECGRFRVIGGESIRRKPKGG